VPLTLNRRAYQQLIDENIEWILQQPRTLERDHIIEVIKHSVIVRYEEIPQLKNENKMLKAELNEAMNELENI